MAFSLINWTALKRLPMSLTRREHEIARLVSEGLADREIATRLFLAPRTVEWHLEQIRGKLGFNSRAQIAAWFVRHGSSDASPPVTTARSYPNNLPLRATTFVGRALELAEVKRLLAETRLLTLTGVAGVGKTRLALQAATTELERFPDGAWFADLSPIEDPALVSRTVCDVLGVRPGPEEPALDALASRLRDSHLLLILDNCEHLIEASARLADRLLGSCAGVTLLAASRESLHVEGETTWRVPPLSTPDARAAAQPDQLLGYESVALFIDRALKAAPDHPITREGTVAVAEICRRLDGIPLAIEMAAARASMLSPEQMLDRLEYRVRLLTGGSRIAVRRHQTLMAALDWSHALLTDEERKMFRRLSVFAGGFTLESAEAVASRADLDPRSVLDLVSRLVDKSLVVPVVGPDGAIRYQMLTTVLEFGRERLVESREAEAIRGLHLKYFLSLAEQAAPRLFERSETAMDQVEIEIDNLRLAIAWATSSDVDAGLRTAIALDQFWRMRGRFAEGREALNQVLASEGGDPALRLNATAELALLCYSIGDPVGTADNARRAIAMGRVVGPCGGLARALGVAGFHSRWRGDLTSARAEFEESVRVGSNFSRNPWQYFGRQGLVRLAFDSGDVQLGRRLGDELLAIWTDPPDPWTHSIVHTQQAGGELDAGDLEAACKHLVVAIPIDARFSFHQPGSTAVRLVSQIEAARGRHERAWRLLGAARSLQNGFPFVLWLSQAGRGRPPDPGSSPVAPERVAELVAEGEAMSAAEAYEHALLSLRPA